MADGSVGDSNSNFAIELLSRLNSNESNVLFSPWSLFNALAMTFVGARGNTADQLSHALGLKGPASFESVQTALTDLMGLDSVEYKTANKIWVQSGYQLLAEFQNHLKVDFLSEIGEVDYKKDSEGAKQVINSWVEKQTNGKIANLIPSRMLDALTRLVLTSAVYFKGSWLHEFPKDNTDLMSFHVDANRTMDVQMMYMNAKKDMMYFEEESFQVLAMPYRGGRLTMNIILPKQGVSLQSVIANMQKDKGIFRKCICPAILRRNVEIFIPRFKFDFNETYNSILHNLGICDMFSDKDADFSGITNEKPGLKVKAVIQKAFIEVNEEGTEAAAATAVIMMTRCAMPRRQPPIIFKADRPFIFLIRDIKTNVILFMGKVVNPTED